MKLKIFNEQESQEKELHIRLSEDWSKRGVILSICDKDGIIFDRGNILGFDAESGITRYECIDKKFGISLDVVGKVRTN